MATGAGLLAVSGCLDSRNPETEEKEPGRRNLAPGETYHTTWGLDICVERPAVSNSLEISQGHESSDGTNRVGAPTNEEFLFVHVSVKNTTKETRMIPKRSAFVIIRGENQTTPIKFDYPFQSWRKLASPVTGGRYWSVLLDPKSKRHGWLIFSTPVSAKKTVLELGDPVFKMGTGPVWQLHEKLPENPPE